MLSKDTTNIGHDLLAALLSIADRGKYFARLLEEPVTPSQIRQRIRNENASD